MLQNLSSAAVVIGALSVNIELKQQFFLGKKILIWTFTLEYQESLLNYALWLTFDLYGKFKFSYFYFDISGSYQSI